jgi:hypothetical protein
MEIEAWLRGLRLEHYEPAFRDNGIDAEILPKLTAEDLKDLGVTRVGDRRKLLDGGASRQGAGFARPVGHRTERANKGSLDRARTQQAKSWELRTATSSARLLSEQGRVGEAHELLAPVYGGFTEGFATRDLKEAKAPIEELESSAPPMLA